MSNHSNQLAHITQVAKSSFKSVGVFSLFINLLMLTVPIYMLQLFDRVLAAHSYATLFYLTAIALFALLIMGLLDIVRNYIVQTISSWFEQKLSPIALTRAPDELLQGRNYGGQALRDISSIKQFVGSYNIFYLFDSPWVPIYLAVIFFMHPPLGYLATFGAIILFLLALLNELVTKKPAAEASKESLQNQSRIDIALRNPEAIQAMGMMENLVSHWVKDQDKAQYWQTIATRRGSVITVVSRSFRLTLQLLMLGVGAYYVVQGAISPGVMIAGSILMSRALAPVEQAIGAWKMMQGARGAFARLKLHFNIEPRETAGIKLPTPQGQLILENLYFLPQGTTKPIINNITMHIPPGECLALIGPSAAGKSSLARLMVGAWRPNAGTVRLDGANIYTWDRDDIGNHVGYLPQDIELFSGSIKENIARLGTIDDKAVVDAAILAGVHQMILRLPQGYETNIGPGQFTLSGGQKQRIALARALYRNPCLIVLDEPNSNLDNEGEAALMRAIAKFKEMGKTVIIIAHHPGILKMVNQIAVLRDGQIQMAGPRDEVLNKIQQIAKAHQQSLTQAQQPKGGENGTTA